jgi:tetratricopeptide (TPR) repeat protein
MPAALTALLKYAPPHDPKSLEEAYRLAVYGKQPERALPYLWELYRQAPSLERGKQLANMLIAANDPRTMVFVEGLYTAFPHDAPLRELYLNRLSAVGRLSDAFAVLQNAVQLQPTAVDVHARLVAFALGRSKHDVAIAELDRWTKLYPKDLAALHQLAIVQVWSNHSPQAWNTYARLFAVGGSDKAWREAWLHISQAKDDCTPQGLANLKALFAAAPQKSDLARRLAAAQLEAGFSVDALNTQAALVALPDATTDDVTSLARWSLWYNHTEQGLQLLQTTEMRSPLPVSVLDEAAGFAARAHRFDRAIWFLKRLTERQPTNTAHWERLAVVQEQLGNLTAASSAWQERFTHDAGQVAQRSQMLSLLVRQRRDADALAAILHWQKVANKDEWRLGAELAQRLGRAKDERLCLEQRVKQEPHSSEALVSLASFEQGVKDPAADRHFRAALALAPSNADLLTRVAQSLVYGAQPAAAEPYMTRLEKLTGLGAESQRVIADFEASRHPARAAAALDLLHALGAGDASTHVQRAQVATALGDRARAQAEYSHAVTLGSTAKEERSIEAAARALEQLGRPKEERVLWQKVAAMHPSSSTPWVALAHLELQAKDVTAAGLAVTRAQAIAPGQADVNAVRAEWLRASGRHIEAADAFAAVHLLEPAVSYWAAAESESRNAAGQYGRASHLARRELAAAPASTDLMESYRRARDKGYNHTTFHALTEGYSGFDRLSLGVGAFAPLGDKARLSLDLDQLGWASSSLQTQQLALGVSTEAGIFTGGLTLQLQRQLTGAALDAGPLGELKFGVQSANAALTMSLSEARWQDTNALVLAGGRHHSANLEGRWQPDPRVAVRAVVGAGQLAVPGQATGQSTLGLAEVALHPDAASPWGLYFQANYHGWGAIGLANGLPDHLNSENVSLGYARRLGPVLMDVQPGVALDSALLPTPTLNALLAWDVSPDTSLELQIGWSGRSIGIGQAGAYNLAQLQGHWWF